jgi:prolyl oligopeptidase
MVPPRVVIEAVLTQLDAQLIPSADKTPMLAAFRNMPQIVPPEEQERLRRLAERAYVESAQPAWQKYRDYIAGSYLPVGRDSVAISSLPNGKDLYALLVRRSTTTELTPEQIHEIGHREVARIDSQMAKIRKDLGFTGTQEQFNEQVLDAPNLRFKSEAEIISHAREIAKRIDPELPRLFRLLPRMPYGVRPIPSERARTIAPYYERPALDGSRAGYFYVRTVDPEKQSKCCMEALILHEAVPGHHLQNALAQEMEGVPEFRLSGGYGAYSEGWGLYAESLGSELGMYQTPYEQYGRLQLEMFRALRLITDTGLHYYGWTREQGITTMLRARGGLITDDFVTSEVDRYIGSPGQALAYKIGELKIKELRARAEKALSAKFDIREFHDIVLRNGSVPLAILERDVDRWLAAATRRSR